MAKSRLQSFALIFVICFSIAILAITILMSMKNTDDLTAILEESIESQLLSASYAARSLIDADRFHSYNGPEDIESDPGYPAVLDSLRLLAENVGATYIYALKEIGGSYYFIFDTDPEVGSVAEIFDEYPDISDVHLSAFMGEDSAGVMNLSDMWGSFNTGAVPIFKDGEVIGIVSTDIADTYIQHSNEASRSNAIFQVSALFATMAIMTFVVAMLMRSDRRMQARLFRMANYDVLTGLPNRQYLMSYLPEISEKAIKKNAPFALFLIDLDNFKQVNDNSGHDAGDVLLKSISDYLNGIHADSKSFRPPAGILSMSARIGGDEFVQVVANVRTEDDARAAAEKVLGSFSSETVDRYVDKYKVGLSIGVAMFPHHTSDYRMLIKYADLAMYHAKNSGKHTYRIYSEEMDQTEKKGAHANERRRNRA